MAATTIRSQVDSLLTKRIAEARVKGAIASDIEVAAVIESIALNLLLQPRTVLYTAHLTRNAVLAVVAKELQQISTLRKSVADTANKTFSVRNTSYLESAVTSLLQMEDLEKLSTSSSQFQSFNRSVDSFLNKELSKNIKKKGATSLVRPSAEAATDAVSDFATLDGYHSDFLDLLGALTTGVENFINSPISTAIGLSTASRVRSDIESIIASVEEDLSGAGSRDYANRLISSRAALKVIGSPPNIFGPVLDTQSQKPDGYILKATSSPAPATVANSVNGPFVVTAGGSLTVQVGGASVTKTTAELVQSGNAAAFYGGEISFSPPVTVAAQNHLFVRFEALSSVTGWTLDPDGTYSHGTLGSYWSLGSDGVYSKSLKVTLNDSNTPVSFASMTALLAQLNSSLGSLGTAAEYLYTGSNRLLIFGNPLYIDTVSVVSSASEPDVSSTVGVPRFYTLSSHELLSLTVGQSGTINESVTTARVVEALSFFMASLVSSQRLSDTSIQLTTIDTSPGMAASVFGQFATDLGLVVTQPSTSTFSLSGTVYGVPTSTVPLNHSLLVDVGDTVTIQSVVGEVSKVTTDSITISVPFPTFTNGDVSISSALVEFWTALKPDLDTLATTVFSSFFKTDLKKVEDAVVALSSDTTQSRRNVVYGLLNSLETLLNSVVAVLSSTDTLLPVGAASIERVNARGVINTLLERKLDKAADLFQSCRVKEMLESTYQTGSYAGDMMKAAEDFAKADVKFVNRTLDEDNNTTLVPNRRAT